MTILKSFTCFSQLPPELRSHIFDLTLPGPRIITLFREPGSPSCTLEATASDTDTLNALSLTCKESHNAMKAHYQSFLHPHINERYPVWMDINIDTLYVPDIGVFDDLMRPSGKYGPLGKVDLGPVQQLALDIPIVGDHRGSYLDLGNTQWQFAAIKCFSKLRKVTFVPRFVDFDQNFAEQLYEDLRDNYRLHGDLFDIQDEYDPQVLSKLKFSIMNYEDFCHGKS